MSSPPPTVIERVLARASGASAVRPGDIVVVEVDLCVLIDLQFRSFNGWRRPNRIADPDRVAIIFDHAVPAPSVHDANAGKEARGFAEEFGIDKIFDVGDHGICHQLIAERGLALPGQILLCADSHTCAAGVFGTAARGLGPSEILQVLCTGQTWMSVPETLRCRLVGALPEGASGKDIFLELAGSIGFAAENRCIEYVGPGIAALPFHERRTVAVQSVELFADFGIFEVDDTTLRELRAAGVGDCDVPPLVQPDPSSEVAGEITLDLSEIEPMISGPDRLLGNTMPVRELAGMKLDQCFIGSCANGQLEDLELAAEILRGRRVASGVRLIVTPASQRVARLAARNGTLATLLEAGAVVTNPACGACFGYDLGVVGDGEVCLTASTRNFRGRMGASTARIHLASTATVASSAVAGEVVEPRRGG